MRLVAADTFLLQIDLLAMQEVTGSAAAEDLCTLLNALQGPTWLWRCKISTALDCGGIAEYGVYLWRTHQHLTILRGWTDGKVLFFDWDAQAHAAHAMAKPVHHGQLVLYSKSQFLYPAFCTARQHRTVCLQEDFSEDDGGRVLRRKYFIGKFTVMDRRVLLVSVHLYAQQTEDKEPQWRCSTELPSFVDGMTSVVNEWARKAGQSLPIVVLGDLNTDSSHWMLHNSVWGTSGFEALFHSTSQPPQFTNFRQDKLYDNMYLHSSMRPHIRNARVIQPPPGATMSIYSNHLLIAANMNFVAMP